MQNKVVIIGAGNVGTTAAFALMSGEVVSEIGLIDIDTDRALGEALDLSDGLPFLRPIAISSGGYSLCRGASVIIITAGFNQQVGETRLDLVEKNSEVLKKIIPKILEYHADPLLIIATNPVDILTYYTIKTWDLPSARVIGSGTVLDTARLRHVFSRHCNIDPRNVHGYVIGEHGDDAVIVWSALKIAGMEMEAFCRECTRQCPEPKQFNRFISEAAYRIIEKKGATYYSIALALKKIVESILRNEHSILTVSTLISNYAGLEDVCLSLPGVINKEGIKRVLPLPLDPQEYRKLHQTAQKLKIYQKKLMAPVL